MLCAPACPSRVLAATHTPRGCPARLAGLVTAWMMRARMVSPAIAHSRLTKFDTANARSNPASAYRDRRPSVAAWLAAVRSRGLGRDPGPDRRRGCECLICDHRPRGQASPQRASARAGTHLLVSSTPLVWARRKVRRLWPRCAAARSGTPPTPSAAPSTSQPATRPLSGPHIQEEH